MNSPLRIELFGGLQLVQAENKITSRFQTRKTAALLAYLAYYRGKIISREVLTDILWPDSDPVSARNSFRVALNSLRRQLEPPTVPPGAVLFADRACVQLNPAACMTDVAEFEDAIRKDKNAANDEERIAALLEAADVYKGLLLVGWYEEWIDLEQTRLAEVYAGVLRRLTALLIRHGEYDQALQYAHRAVHTDPLREETNRNLMRLYAAVGKTSEAVEQYRKLETLLRDQLGSGPSSATRELMKQISAGQFGSGAPSTAVGAPTVLDSTPQPWIIESRDTTAPASNRAASYREATGARSSEGEGGRGSIPIQFTRFFGREAELSDLREMLRPGMGRLITITGPGGTGKTRLSVEVASLIRDEFYDGRVWVVPLSDLTDASQIPSALLAVLRLSQQPDIPVLDQLSVALGALPALVVLDNLEQVAETAGEVVQTLLVALRNTTVLTTSRQRLGISGERDYPLAPLPTPSLTLENPESLSAFSSIALFVDRARGVRPDFQITARNSVAIAEVCRRLDGLPLALELAAASIRLLSPAQMLARLQADDAGGMSSGNLLASERRDFSPRHRSLRIVMDDSYELLPDDLGVFFTQLSVFRGGWTLHAAEMICGESYALDFLDLLNHRSLVVSRENDSGIRFYLLETIRQYAEGKLTEAQKSALKQSHSLYYSNFAAAAEAHLNGPDSEHWFDLVELEHNNLRAAIVWLRPHDPAPALSLCSHLWRYWYARGYASEGVVQFENVLRTVQTIDRPRGLREERLLFTANHGAGRLALSLGNTSSAASYFEAALVALDKVVSPERGDEADRLARTMLTNDIAIASDARGDLPTTERAYRDLVTLYRADEDQWAEACALTALGGALDLLGRTAEARAAFDASAVLRERIGDRIGAREARELSSAESLSKSAGSSDAGAVIDTGAIAASYLHLGHIASERGDDAAAIPLLKDALWSYERTGDSLGAAIANERIGVVSLRQGDLETARRAVDDALLLRRSRSPSSDGSENMADAIAFTWRLLRKIERRSVA